MRRKQSIYKPAFLTLILAALLSCAGMGERSVEYYEPLTREEPDSPLPAEEAPKTSGGEKRESTAEEDAGTVWSEDSEAPAMAEALPSEKAAGSATTRSSTASTGRPQVSGLKAGFADDNKQFNYFVQFLQEYGPSVDHIPIPIEERIVLRVHDSEGKSIPNADIRVSAADGQELTRGLTYADGTYLLFPAEYGGQQSYTVEITYNQQRQRLSLDRFGRREVVAAFNMPRAQMSRIPLDLLFILDTTGSMGEEIQRLKTTIELINLNLSSLSTRPRVRFGMVLYKDRGDEYVTEVVPFTENLQAFQSALDRVEASGGGDTPEDLQAALEQAVKMSWNRGGVRLGFIITDAPPHLDYGQSYTYARASREAKEKGIKVFSVGTGGLDLLGEIVLRQIAQYTSAKYIFLTYGESGESEGGAPGSVSHHTGANYQTDKLEAIIIRFAKEELSQISDQPIEEEEEYFTANKVGEEQREETLNKLFSMAISQLIDYSSVRIDRGTAAAVLPLSPAQSRLALNSEYFTEQLILSFGRDVEFRELFRIVERKDLQNVLEELELQLTDLSEEQGAARVGELIGAELLIIGKLYSTAKGYELFLKLVRVETGEVLSVTKAIIDAALGLEA
ncbi:MAG: VWA domain-containing protein [Spirochaetaceae bacterium]|nr:MAG: VWA domain-containing protein [Spirochaetaceae bacterium]